MSYVDSPLRDLGYACISLKTTGLTHGYDRICEVSVAVADPGQPIRLALDTLVHPERPLAGAEIHGIRTMNISMAPNFEQVALDLLRQMQGRVVVGHNLSLPWRFLTTEFNKLGVRLEGPQIDTMSLTSMLTRKPNRPLLEACDSVGIEARIEPTAAVAALDTAKLLRHLLGKVGQMGLNTLGSLRGKKRHPFQATLEQDAMLKGMTFDLEESVVRFSRHERGVEGSADLALALYWDALLVALDDLVITEEEQEHLARLKGELELEDERIHMLHARAFSGSLVAMIDAGEVTEDHRTHLTSLRACLAKLGWCPGD